jgi:CheY-like chemotaxis protein
MSHPINPLPVDVPTSTEAWTTPRQVANRLNFPRRIIRPATPLRRAQRSPAARPPRACPAMISPPPVRMTDTILLVEDSSDDVFFMERAMKAAGFSTPLQIAKDGKSALDYLSGINGYGDRQKFPLPSLVLLDLKLPHVLGLDVLKWIRSQSDLQVLPVIVLTSSGERSDLERAYRLGANSFMVKPAPDDLPALAKCLADYWFKFNLISRVR